jgi:hypothetical protein
MRQCREVQDWLWMMDKDVEVAESRGRLENQGRIWHSSADLRLPKIDGLHVFEARI